jgi:hypothetical protein
LCAIVFVALLVLALGTTCPIIGDNAMRFVRAIIPGYRMIRQPDKILCIAPVLPILLAAASFPVSDGSVKQTGVRHRVLSRDAILVAFSAAIVLEQFPRFKSGLCILPTEWTAYTAVAADAGPRQPRAVCVPLFDGDAHWGALYEWGAMQSHVRIMGGYSASYDRNYTAEVYEPLKGLNRGIIDDSGIQVLRKLGCSYIILHYPICKDPGGKIVLLRFLQNPALRLLVDDNRHGIASFAIKEEDHGQTEGAIDKQSGAAVQ